VLTFLFAIFHVFSQVNDHKFTYARPFSEKTKSATQNGPFLVSNKDHRPEFFYICKMLDFFWHFVCYNSQVCLFTLNQFRSAWSRRLQQHLLLSGQSRPRPKLAQPDRRATAFASTQHLHSSRYSLFVRYRVRYSRSAEFIYFFLNLGMDGWDDKCWILMVISDKRYS